MATSLYGMDAKQQGYMVVEWMLYLTIFLIIISFTSLAGRQLYSNRMELGMVTEELVYQLRRVQLLAITGSTYTDKNLYYQVVFEKTGYYFPVYDGYGSRDHRIYFPPSIICWNHREARRFHGTGLPADKKSIILQDTRTGVRTEILIGPQTGRIRWRWL